MKNFYFIFLALIPTVILALESKLDLYLLEKLDPAYQEYKINGDIALERFLDISSNSCAIYTADTPDFNYLNLFEKLKPNELVWSLIDCAQFEILTEGLNEIELIEPIYFNKQKQ